MKRKIFTFLSALAIFLGAAAPVPAAARTTAGSEIIEADTMSQLEQSAAELINQQREANGLEPLTVSPSLSAKARVKAQDMRSNGYFSHTSPRYGSPFAMMRTLGVSYISAAENIAMGYPAAQSVVRAWMTSPSHRDKILSNRYTEMGIGQTSGYWTLWLIS